MLGAVSDGLIVDMGLGLKILSQAVEPLLLNMAIFCRILCKPKEPPPPQPAPSEFSQGPPPSASTAALCVRWRPIDDNCVITIAHKHILIASSVLWWHSCLAKASPGYQWWLSEGSARPGPPCGRRAAPAILLPADVPGGGGVPRQPKAEGGGGALHGSRAPGQPGGNRTIVGGGGSPGPPECM